MTESEMVKTILKVQIVSSKPSNSMGKNVPLQKDEVFIDLKCTKRSEGRKIQKNSIIKFRKIMVKYQKKFMSKMLRFTSCFFKMRDELKEKGEKC